MLMLRKPSSLERRVAQYERRMLREKAKRADEAREARIWSGIRKAIYQRDGGCCRVCGRRVLLYAPNPLLQAETHHLVYRSAGGQDISSNLICACAVCHEKEHVHVLQIAGNGDGLVTIAEINPETGRTVRVWESPCPA